MKLRSALLLGLPLVLLGCSGQRSASPQQRSSPFVFQALDLRQQDAQGRLLWRVSSPEARYDLSRRIAQSWRLQGEILSQGRPMYRLQASHGTVLGDGQVIQLEGDVRVQRLGADPVLIRAARMRWYPAQQRLELDRHAEAQTAQLKLRANQATLYLDRDRLDLRGQPELQQRDLRLRVQQLSWSPGSGALVAPGPAVATMAASQQPNLPGRTLRAAGLSGNSLRRSLVLQGPLEIQAPDLQGWMKAQTSTLNLTTNTVSSELPFEAGLKALSLRGGGFALDLDDQVALITRQCRLQQPDASLSAGSCRWNWRREQVQASGGVELRRRANQQITRARSLNGTIGANGQLVFSSPGSRVQSSFRLPQRRSQASPASPAIRL